MIVNMASWNILIIATGVFLVAGGMGWVAWYADRPERPHHRPTRLKRAARVLAAYAAAGSRGTTGWARARRGQPRKSSSDGTGLIGYHALRSLLPPRAAPAVLVRLREAAYQFRWAHSSPVRPGDLPRPEPRLRPLPGEDEATLAWVRELQLPDPSRLAVMRAATWTLHALTRRLAAAAPVPPPEPVPQDDDLDDPALDYAPAEPFGTWLSDETIARGMAAIR